MHSNPAKISAKDDRGEGIGLLESLVLSQGSPHRTASGEMDSDRLWAIFTPAGRLWRLKRWRVFSNSRPLGS
jgi:hypothetical protein